MDYEDYIKAINVLKATRKYIKYAHDEAEAKHDNYGEFYMDAELYKIMEETEKLLLKINTVITQFGTHKCGEPEPVLHCENCGHNFNRRQ